MAEDKTMFNRKVRQAILLIGFMIVLPLCIFWCKDLCDRVKADLKAKCVRNMVIDAGKEVKAIVKEINED